MAIVRENLTTDDSVVSGTSGSITFGFTGTTDRLLVIVCADNQSSAPPSTPSGWTQANQSAGSSRTATLWYKISDGTETSASWTYTKGAQGAAAVIEYSGNETTGVLDQNAVANGVSATWTHGAINSPDNSLHVGVTSAGGVATAVDDGFTLVWAALLNLGGGASIALVEKITGSEGSLNPAITGGGFGVFRNVQASFLEGAASTPIPAFMRYYQNLMEGL